MNHLPTIRVSETWQIFSHHALAFSIRIRFSKFRSYPFGVWTLARSICLAERR